MPTATSGRNNATWCCPIAVEARDQRHDQHDVGGQHRQLDDARQAPRLLADRSRRPEPRLERWRRRQPGQHLDRAQGDRRGEQARGVGMADRSNDHRPQRDRHQQRADIRAATGASMRRGLTARCARPRRVRDGSRCGSALALAYGQSASALSIAPPMALHGWIILDKPVGLGSTKCVGCGQARAARGGRAQDQRRPRRDARPARHGVLPIALGEATKLAGHMLDATKAYDFTIALRRRRPTRSTSKARSSPPATICPTLRRGRGDPAALHRPDRAGPARLFGAQGRRQARLRPRAGGRGGRAEDARGDGASISSTDVGPRSRSGARRESRSPSPPPSPRAPTSAASRATSRWRSAPSATSPCCAAPGPVRSPWNRRFRWTF